jgi:hypothetical protein
MNQSALLRPDKQLFFTMAMNVLAEEPLTKFIKMANA